MYINKSCQGAVSAAQAIELDRRFPNEDVVLYYNTGKFFLYYQEDKPAPGPDKVAVIAGIIGSPVQTLSAFPGTFHSFAMSKYEDSPAGRPKEIDGKPVLSLVPRGIVECIAKVRSYGNRKYGSPDGWKQMSRQDYWEACLRHAEKSRNDIDAVDEESGLPHIWHLACDLSFILSGVLK
jgi:hypothetical protein